MRFFPWILRPVILLMLASVALVENSKAQSLCDTLFIPRGNMFPPERRELCNADTIILQGVRPENGYEMRWFRNGVELTGETQEILKVTQAGTFSFRLFRDGCLSTVFDTLRISFRNQLRPKVRQLSLQQLPDLPGSQFTMHLQSLGNAASISLSWFRNGILENNSGLTLTGRNTGRYRVRTDSAGCSSFSNEVLVRPAGSFVPQICLSEPVEPNGLRIEWIPPSDTAIKQFKVYRKKYFESVFSFVDTVNPAAGAWKNDTILYRSAYDVMLTARVNGPGGTYESEPSPVNQTIYLSVQPAPAGSSGGNVLNWNSYEGFPVSRYYILRNEQVIDSVSGTQNTWQDANPPANPEYRIEAPATENCSSTISDIDGNVYQTVQIGSQVWMKENLKVSKYRNGDPIPTGLDSAAWQNASSGAYAIYDDNSSNNTTYGKLFNWYAVADPRGLCPAGWHVPTNKEWKNLSKFLDPLTDTICGDCYCSLVAGGSLKAISSLWYQPNNDATNSSGFTGLPGGYRFNQAFTPYGNMSLYGYWWTSSDSSSAVAWLRALDWTGGHLWKTLYVKTNGISVRCLKDGPETGLIDSLDCAGKVQLNYLAENSPAENVQIRLPYFGGNGGSYNGQNIPSAGVSGLSANLLNGNFATGNDSLTFIITGTPAGFGTATFSISIGGKQCQINMNVADTGSVRDIDGNLYTSIKIGTQEWMQQNLKVGKYRNGDVIPLIGANSEWATMTDGAISVYDNNFTNDTIFGKLYNWYAVADSRNLCPSGWHVPGDSEWTTLENFLGGRSVAGNKMRSSGTIQDGTGLWNDPVNYGSGNNTSGFCGLPGGYRVESLGQFFMKDDAGAWWAASDSASACSWSRVMQPSCPCLGRNCSPKVRGYSVRCLKDGPETGIIDSLDCAGKVQTNYLAENSPAEHVQIMLPYFGGNGGSYNGQNIPSAGVSGLSANFLNGNFATGNDSLTFSITGTPAGYGTATFSISIGGKQCNINMNVADTGSVRDIDGNLYTSIKIGNQEWMQQNLKTSKYRDGTPIPTNLSNTTWQNTLSGAYAIYNNIVANNTTYGKLYNWYAVNDPSGLCPAGWHVPSDAEWITLKNFLGGAPVAGGKMKTTGTKQAGTGLWLDPNTDATNSSGFTGLPGGHRASYNGLSYYIEAFGYWWSSTEENGDSTKAWVHDLFNGSSTCGNNILGKKFGHSVRCLKDTPEAGNIDSLDCAGMLQMNYLAENSPAENVQIRLPYFGGNGGSYNGQNIPSAGVSGLSANLLNGNFATGNDSLTFIITGTPAGFGTATFSISIGGKQCNINMNVADTGNVRDIDGNLYTSIKIGNQEWMQQNLKVSKYRNGDAIGEASDAGQWVAIWNNGNPTGQTAWCYYNNDAANNTVYGKLYNWYAVADPRGLCPAGWHVPSDGEWTILENFLGGSTVAGGQMKSTGTIEAGTGLWYSPNQDATNSSGFTGLPGGLRYFDDGFYVSIGISGFWWSSTGYSSADAWNRYLEYGSRNSYLYNRNKAYGFSVRCLRD